jgi:hypothetical protein
MACTPPCACRVRLWGTAGMVVDRPARQPDASCCGRWEGLNASEMGWLSGTLGVLNLARWFITWAEVPLYGKNWNLGKPKRAWKDVQGECSA